MNSARICGLADIPDGTARQVEVGGVPVALVRIGDRVLAVGDICSHAEVSLSDGEVDVDECTIECWKHGSLFSLETGKPLTLPATKPVEVLAVRIEGDDIVVAKR
ncbi:MAG: non-heme iron oxygenase ferredoxin subunit [Acidimicrobiales bacterium]|jgi:nitrite reductase/ring-hydroxylating ferredoxin subunit|nr:non-heme iron oxygenase ferredoxin subunit [Acidimicrobiales bacterium]MDP7118291.1 non-heme iron oxygenase ferredoxin subunit [Acidimicrobiales bacterium]MDP7411724.1 non-heme iron oxygenase ferredoxin subunit [Acidimicrobiales bacterium]MEE1521374.1 non-heme iron oxygenase ferredoxin subunit [Acidimicrobiales bacterium]MEE1570022.1 non-heme iron oxygenase ferredoxin subunit [Acidimicrobiales bacterium]